MATVYANRVRMTSSTVGAGALTLGAATAGYVSFAEAGIADGSEVTYCLEEGTSFEIGRGVFTLSGTVLSRAPLIAKPAGGVASTTPLTLTGAATVYLTLVAEDIAAPAAAVPVSATLFTNASPVGFDNLVTLTLSLNSVYRTNFWDSNLTKDSGADWRCFSITPTGTPGAISHVPGTGIVMEANTGRLVLIPRRGVNPTQIGAKWDSLTLGQQTIIHVARDYCIANNVPLYMEGVYMPLNATLDLDVIPTIDADGAEFREPSAGFNGLMVRSAGGAVSDYKRRKLRVKGINVAPNQGLGQFGWQGTPSLATGVQVFNDRGGATSTEIFVSRLKRGCLLGEIEKNIIRIHAQYCGIVVESEFSAGTSDTCRYEICGTLNEQAFVSGGGDTSEIVHLMTEGTLDDGSVVASHRFPAINRPKAYMEIGNGKFMQVEGRHRGANGRVFITDDRKNGSASFPSASGINFNQLSTVHTYGLLYDSYGNQKLSGSWIVDDNGPGRANYGDLVGTIACPTWHLRELRNASEWHGHAIDCYTREFVRFGDTTVGINLKCKNAHLGRYTGNMRNADQTGYNPLTGEYPTNLTYMVLEATENCFVICGFEGNVKALPGCIATHLHFEDGASWIRHGYKITDDAGATLNPGVVTAHFCGSLNANEIFGKTWLFDGISVANIVEFNGPGYYRGGKWHVGSEVVGVAAQFNSISHVYNTDIKQAGQIAWDATSAQHVYASGATDTASWKAMHDKSDVYASVGYQALTTAYEGWALVLGHVLSAANKKITDRFYFDLYEAGIDPAVDLICAYPFWTNNQILAKVNLSRDLYHATEVNAPTWTTLRGFAGNGSTSYLDTGFDASSAAHGMTINTQHIGIYEFTKASGGFAGQFSAGTDNARLRIQAQGGTGNIVTTGNVSQSLLTTSSSAPHHLMGSRTGSTVAKVFDNGQLADTTATASSGALPNTMRVGRANTNFNVRQMGFFHCGLGLTDARCLALYNAFMRMGKQLGAV